MIYNRENIRIGLLIVFLITSLFIWSVVLRSERAELTVAFLDIGQGDAIFIESPSGNQMLIDGGPSSTILQSLGKVMSFYDRSIDVMVATHPDKDHIGGLPDVLRRYTVGEILRSGAHNDTNIFREFDTTVSTMHIATRLARRGMVIDFGDGVYAEILFPDHDVSRVTDTNDASIVIRIVYGDTEFMLTGDAPEKIENHLVARDGLNLKSDVLKVGHHGSKTSSSELFLAAVSPQYAVISAGEDNSYGHPHQEVLSRFIERGSTIVSTIESGTIVFHSNGEILTIKK